jgi:hypothetical protein
MNFYTYIGLTPTEFQEQYIDAGYVSMQKHHEFPLAIFAYARDTVKEQKWDHVTSRCRGIVINTETGEIVSRPFEKFHNYGSELGCMDTLGEMLNGHEPTIWEKMDGFMCTLYTWQGVDYIASKGSFHSIHAKWATAWLRKKFSTSLGIPAGHTAVFEGLHRDLRIVVDYGLRQELVLLAIINNETGEEFSPGALFAFADSKGLSTPKPYNIGLDAAVRITMATGVFEDGGDEGFVLTWYQKGQPPFRLKLKYIEYLRLHRMVTGVSPKRIWEVLANNQSSELDEYLKQSTPWFSAFVNKWLKALTLEFKRIEKEVETRYAFSGVNPNDFLQPNNTVPVDFAGLRKAYALKFTTEENKPYSAGLFALLDGKDIKPVIWKMVKHMTAGANPMVDAHNT